MSEKEKISFEKGISPIIPYKNIPCKDVEPQSYSCAYHIYLPWKCKFAWEDDSNLEPKLVSIDKCLLHEITHLWEIGIKTTGCCCGHGDFSKAFISVHPAYTEAMKAEASLVMGVPLELNFLGIREGRYYPRSLFWEIAGRVGSPMTFGFDAHQPEVAADLASLPRAEEIVRKYGLNYIGKPTLHTLA